MFRLATVNDLIRLRVHHETRDAEPHRRLRAWGLKAMGTMFCLERIVAEFGAGSGAADGARVLEAGAGLDLFFEQHLPAGIDYWVADEPGFYDADRFAARQDERTRTTLVETLLGEHSERLPEHSFDVVFSVSVLEHAADDAVARVVEDSRRVLRPGGLFLHSIDVWPTSRKPELFRDALSAAGFAFEEPPGVVWSFGPDDPTLVEPLETVFMSYFGRERPDLWSKPKHVRNHAATLLVAARAS